MVELAHSGPLYPHARLSRASACHHTHRRTLAHCSHRHSFVAVAKAAAVETATQQQSPEPDWSCFASSYASAAAAAAVCIVFVSPARAGRPPECCRDVQAPPVAATLAAATVCPTPGGSPCDGLPACSKRPTIPWGVWIYVTVQRKREPVYYTHIHTHSHTHSR